MKKVSILEAILFAIGFILIMTFNSTAFAYGVGFIMSAWLVAVIYLIVYPNA